MKKVLISLGGKQLYYTLTTYYSIVFIAAAIMFLSSCGAMTKLSDAEYMHRANIQKQIDFTQAEYNYKLDSLYTEYYKINK
tara:strand:+ start:3096 stop:3338 length:243 start_codon:yes stop_codon:yes gene_type:complete